MSNNLAFTVPDEADMGPAMRDCTEAEREFVVAMFQTGAQNYTQAALATGRFGTRESAQMAGSRWMARPRVLLALDEFTRITMKGGLATSTKALLEIANDPMHKDRFKASVEILNRNGHIVETVSRHIVEDVRDTKEIIRMAVEYAKRLGDQSLAYKLLGNAVPKEVLDAEFTEVKEDDLGDLLA